MSLQAVVKQHGGRRHEKAPLGGDEIAAAGVAFLSCAGFVGGQVKGLGKIAAVIFAELPHC